MRSTPQNTPDEPVLESAPLASTLAAKLCQVDPETGESCAWNHGFWQYLRALDLVTTPVHHRDFFRQALAQAGASGGPPRVLISAAADYAMLGQVLGAFAARGIVPRVSVIDLCGTPLALNEWYAKRAGLKIECARVDVLDFVADTPYDLVCSHAFLGQFAPAQRGRLVHKWRELLRPGGLAVTVNRIRPDGGTGRTGFTPAQAQAFCAAVARKAEALRDRLEIAPAEIGRMAAAYAARQSGYSVTRREEVTELFETGGFRISHLSCATIGAAATGALSGPTTPGGVEFACLIAERP